MYNHAMYTKLKMATSSPKAMTTCLDCGIVKVGKWEGPICKDCGGDVVRGKVTGKAEESCPADWEDTLIEFNK